MGGQHLIVDRYELRRGFCLFQRLGNHERHSVANVADAIRGQNGSIDRERA
jgi:hypothetical protein